MDWIHDVKIIVPKKVRSEVGLLFIGGGANGRDVPDSVGEELAEIAVASGTVVTELGHSRTILRVSGEAAREVLARGLPVDLEPGVFAPGAFAQSGIHGVSVLCHRSGRDQFDLIVPRNFAVVIYEWLEETAAQFGYTVAEAST